MAASEAGAGGTVVVTPPASSDWDTRESMRQRKLDEFRARMTQFEKTMRWWPDCMDNLQEKRSKVMTERDNAREGVKMLKDNLDQYGWYWGPISGEAAEKILSNEPDGSFIVRDSSDDHYIFSLTYKFYGIVRDVKIEDDQRNFSFGSCTKFKSHTIVEFVENAVEHSRSGRYLFFVHRRPVLGPKRVQLLHPVSRFKRIQSLQHMCRFVILKMVRRDLIHKLPLPRRLTDYLNSPHYYCEQ